MLQSAFVKYIDVSPDIIGAILHPYLPVMDTSLITVIFICPRGGRYREFSLNSQLFANRHSLKRTALLTDTVFNYLSTFFPSSFSYKNNCRKRTALLPVPEVSACERVDCVWFATRIKKVLLWSKIDPKTSLIIFLYVFFVKVQRRFLVRLPDFFIRIIDKDGVHDVSIPSKSWGRK